MGALISLVGSRYLAFAIFGAGFLAIAGTLYQGIKSRGAQLEAAKWAAAAMAKQAGDRAANFKVDNQTINETGNLQHDLDAIRQRWATPSVKLDQPIKEVK